MNDKVIEAIAGELSRLKAGGVKVSFTFANLKDAAEFDDGEIVEIRHKLPALQPAMHDMSPMEEMEAAIGMMQKAAGMYTSAVLKMRALVPTNQETPSMPLFEEDKSEVGIVRHSPEKLDAIVEAERTGDCTKPR